MNLAIHLGAFVVQMDGALPASTTPSLWISDYLYQASDKFAVPKKNKKKKQKCVQCLQTLNCVFQ
jgi:hypothetical protein